MFRFPLYQFTYPEKKLTMDEMLAKFIDGGKREHEEMEIFIREFRTTNDLLLKEKCNLLSLGEPKPIRIILELPDRSIPYPRGIVKNVLIKLDEFVFPIDFVILDMPENSRILIIFRKPFLATARAMIDVFNKKITLKVGDDEVVFNMEQSMKKPSIEYDECYSIDNLDKTINEESQVY
nr:hypothetical protein [Tanacetum cinerariifolium]